MKFKPWTLGLAALGVISLASTTQAEEAQNQVMTAVSSTTLSGYVNTSAIWQVGRGSNPVLPGRSFDGTGSGKHDGFNLDVAKLQIEKPLDDGQWSAGYQVGLLFGPDANIYATQSNGNAADFGVKDANVTVKLPFGNGLDLKLGYWESPIGYEVFDAGANPNYSRSLGYSIEPKQFTGLLGSYRLFETFTISAGIANSGWSFGANRGDSATYVANNRINLRTASETAKTYLGSFTFIAPERAGALKGASIYGGVVDTVNPDLPEVINYYVGLTLPLPLEGLSLGGAWDYRQNAHSATVSSAHAWVGAVYLSYQATARLKFCNRAEYGVGSNNTWYYIVPQGVASADKHLKNEMLTETFTLDYSLWAHVVTRAEFRWDREINGNHIFGDPANPERNAYSLALNVIYRF